MERSRLETKVGLFVFVGLVLLAVLLIQFSKGTSLFRGTYELRLNAVNVGGLKQRASVLLSGVQVGAVAGIQLAPDGKSVTILLKIYNDCKIYPDARFVIEQSGFLGDQFVAVVPTANQGAPLRFSNPLTQTLGGEQWKQNATAAYGHCDLGSRRRSVWAHGHKMQDR